MHLRQWARAHLPRLRDTRDSSLLPVLSTDAATTLAAGSLESVSMFVCCVSPTKS